MFELGRETMNLPAEEKMKFWQGNTGGSFGYITFATHLIHSSLTNPIDTKHSVPRPSTSKGPKITAK